MSTEQYLYPDKSMRDLAYETEIARGTKGVTKFTDQIDGKMVYVLAVPVPYGHKKLHKIAESANLNLTSVAESENMVSEGGQDV